MVNTMMYQSTNNPHNAVKQIKQQPQRLPSSEMEPKPSSRLYNFRELAKPTSALNFSPSLL